MSYKVVSGLHLIKLKQKYLKNMDFCKGCAASKRPYNLGNSKSLRCQHSFIARKKRQREVSDF
jgi:hypothetical protein